MATCHGSAASLSSHPHELLCSYSSCSRATSTTSSSRKIRLGVLEVTTLVAGAILSNLVTQLIQLKLQYHNPTTVSHTVISVFPESPVIAELDTVNNKVKTSYNANVCMADVAESSSSSLLGERILPATDLLFVDGTAYGYRAHLVNDPSTSMHHVDLEEKEDDEHKGGGGDGLFQPAGQHLLIDIRNVDSDFLSDVEQLEGAISHWAAQCELMLSYYHCLESEGVSCAGILLEESSQLHLRTTPHVGLISLSLLTTRRKPNIPSLVSVFAHVFGVVVSSTHPFPRVEWSLKKRGYRFFSHSREDGNTTTLKVFNGDSSDSETLSLGTPLHLPKSVLVDETTQYQKVELHTFAHHSWLASSYLASSTSSLERNKKIFLDGVLQSTLHGLEAYHEALVHPALISHPNPKRVVIIGGGEGATLREVLKHNTIQTCAMVDIDDQFVQLARDHMPEWNDCSDMQPPQATESDRLDYSRGNRSSSCFDDPRTELYLEDAIAWFLNRFGNKDQTAEDDKFDIVIMDALDPSSAVEFSDASLYANQEFLESIMNAIAAGGMLVMQTGEAGEDEVNEAEMTIIDMFVNFENLVHANGAISWKSYVEEHGQLGSPWEFGIAFKDNKSKVNYYSDPAMIDLIMTKRAVRTNSKQSPFRYFDGASMSFYQYPTRSVADDFCSTRTAVLCAPGQGFDPEITNIPASSLGMDMSPNEGQGLVSSEKASIGSYFQIEERVHSLLVMPRVYSIIQSMLATDASRRYDVFQHVFYEYGHSNEFYGDTAFFVDPTKLTSENNQWKNSSSIDTNLRAFDSSFDLSQIPKTLTKDMLEMPFFAPHMDRDMQRLLTTSYLGIDVQSGQGL